MGVVAVVGGRVDVDVDVIEMREVVEEVVADVLGDVVALAH